MINDQHRLRVQILGSGGPMHADGRGNSAYLLWRGHDPLIAIDMGGDTPTALSKAGLPSGRLSTLLISHVHPDHVSGLPDFIWSEVTSGRSRSLSVIGPPAVENFHDAEHLFRKFFSKNGAFPDLSEVLEGNPFKIDFATSFGIDDSECNIDGVRVRAMRVNHGSIPALAFRVETGDCSIVFAGDQTMDDPAFVDFARDADLMIAHAVVIRNAEGTPLSKTVATPRWIGMTAQRARVKHLVLSHWLGAPADAQDASLWSLYDEDGVFAGVRNNYTGKVSVAEDLQCYPVDH